MAKVTRKFYFHSDKGTMREMVESDEALADMSLDAIREFVYTGYEIAIDGVIDTETGKVKAIALNGAYLEDGVLI